LGIKLIVNLYVAVDLAIALFALAVGSYASYKAYRIEGADKTDSTDQRYELEKDFYLVSTVGWMTLGTRIIAIPLFFVTVLSLIPSVPGAMCEFGVFQAGSPYSWADFGVKLVTIFAFGGWLFIDFANRKMKGAPLMRLLSRGFVLLLPLLFVDALLDIAFFGNLEPLVVPCCMVVYSNRATTPFGIGCPFCYVTYEMPLFLFVIPMYAVSLAIVVWSFLVKRYTRGVDVQEETAPLLSKSLVASIFLAVVGTILLVIQVLMGPSLVA
jgi:hypothetical protein